MTAGILIPEHVPQHARVGLDPILDETMLMPVVAPAVLPPVTETAGLLDGEFGTQGPHPDRFRDIVRDLNEGDGQRFNAHLAECAAPVVGRHHRPRDGQSWANWIAEDAGPDEVLGILTHHNRIVSEINEDPGIQAIIRGRREWMADRLQDGAGDWLHPRMREAAQQLRQDVGIWFGDDLRDAMLRQGADGYCVPDRTNVIMRQFLDTADPAQRRKEAIRAIYGGTAVHELLHTVRVGDWLPYWLREAAVEDTAQMIIHNGDAARALEPSPEAFYMQRRSIRQALLHAGSQHISDRMYMMGVTSEGADSRAAERLTYEIDMSWGITDAMSYVTRRLTALEDNFLKAGRDKFGIPYLMGLAAGQVQQELRDDPEKIFGAGYRKPQPHVGAAGLAGAGVATS